MFIGVYALNTASVVISIIQIVEVVFVFIST